MGGREEESWKKLRTSEESPSALPLEISYCHTLPMKYPAENWKQLGEWVATARRVKGFVQTSAWVEAVGRTDRVLLGLERGEETGDRTLELVARALDVPIATLYTILSTTPIEVVEARAAQSSVASDSDDVDTLLFKRPEGLDDEAWERLRSDHEDYWQWLLDKASRER